MKTARPLIACAAILASLLAAYVGAYWFAEKSVMGSEFFHSDSSSFRNWPKWTHRALPHVFRPIRKVELYFIERQERSRYMGTWVAESGDVRIEMDNKMNATIYGLSDHGFAEGSKHPCDWMHLPGGGTSLTVQAPKSATHLQVDVFPTDNPKAASFMSVCPIVPNPLTRVLSYKLWRQSGASDLDK